MFERFRDQYLNHVEECRVCARVWVDYWDMGVHFQYWSVWRPCAIRSSYIKIYQGLFI